jgi:hypothetical protein
MSKKEVFCVATDALVKIATEDPTCVPLRMFFDRQAHVVTTKQCFEKAFAIFAQDYVVKRDARIRFDQYFEKVEVVQVDSDAEDMRDLTGKYSLDASDASLIAAVKGSMASGHGNNAEYFLVTSEKELLQAAREERIKFHDYTEQEFCTKYGS